MEIFDQQDIYHSIFHFTSRKKMSEYTRKVALTQLEPIRTNYVNPRQKSRRANSTPDLLKSCMEMLKDYFFQNAVKANSKRPVQNRLSFLFTNTGVEYREICVHGTSII